MFILYCDFNCDFNLTIFTLAVENKKPTNNNIIMFHVIDPKHNCYHSRSEVRYNVNV